MNPFEMVVLIVAIIAVAGVMRARATHRFDSPAAPPADTAEAERLRAEVRQLKERLHVLERIVTDGERDGTTRLDREIEALRTRDRGADA